MWRLAVLTEHLSDRAPVSGGNWFPALPLGNVQDDDMGLVARSVSADPDDTWFVFDLGYSRPVGGLAVQVPNISPGAEWEIDVSRTADFAEATSIGGRRTVPGGFVDPMTLGWFHPGFWLGRPDVDENPPWPTCLVALPDDEDDAVLGAGRFWRVRIHDPRNRHGHLDVVRAVLSKAFRPSINYSPDDNGLSFQPLVNRVESKAGNRRTLRLAHRRTLQVGWPMLPQDEAFGRAFDMVSRAGIDRVVFVVPDPTDAANMSARSFFATFSQMSNWQLVNAFAGAAGKNMVAFALQFEEHL